MGVMNTLEQYDQCQCKMDGYQLNYWHDLNKGRRVYTC